jgi:DNA-binding NarL/FixJ family response regulator
VSDRVRVFLIGVTPADLASLRARVARVPSLDVAGEALQAQVQSGAVRLPADIEAVLTSPAPAPPRDTRIEVTPDRDPLVEQLTPRERTVLALVADGLGNRDIGRELDISEHTVKFHLASIFGKLGASSRTEAVRRGLRLGLIEI